MMGSRGVAQRFLPAPFLWRWLPAAVWMVLIFGGSTGALSAPHTSRWLEPFLRWLLGGDDTTQAAVEWVHFLLRKAGHVSEYAVLAILLRRALLPSPPSVQPPANAPPVLKADFPLWRFWSGRAAGARAVVLAVAFAVSDELHQAFVPTRGASVADVCLDAAGAVLGVLGLAVLRRARHHRRRLRPAT